MNDVGQRKLITTVTGVVLAGGASSRMGTDKAWLQIEGRPLIARCVGALQQCFTHNIIIANQPDAFASLDLPVFPDDAPGLGPIGGLVTALRRAETPAIFLVACDMPFLNAELIGDMAQALGEHEAVVTRIGGQFEPLHAAYKRAILPSVEAQIAAHQYSLQKLVGQLNLKILSETELSRYSAWQKIFSNVNTPDELEKARRFL